MFVTPNPPARQSTTLLVVFVCFVSLTLWYKILTNIIENIFDQICHLRNLIQKKKNKKKSNNPHTSIFSAGVSNRDSQVHVKWEELKLKWPCGQQMMFLSLLIRQEIPLVNSDKAHLWSENNFRWWPHEVHWEDTKCQQYQKSKGYVNICLIFFQNIRQISLAIVISPFLFRIQFHILQTCANESCRQASWSWSGKTILPLLRSTGRSQR